MSEQGVTVTLCPESVGIDHQIRPSYSIVSAASNSSCGVRARRKIMIPLCSGVGSSSVPFLPANGPRHSAQPNCA